MKLPLSIDIYQMYAYAGVISAGVIAVILSRICATKFRETIDRRFVRLLLFFIVFCVVDAAWGVVGTNVDILGVPVYYTATYAFHTMAALSAIAFSFYGGYYLKLTNGRKRALNICRLVVIVAQAAFIIQNPFTHNAFWIDEAGAYHSTPLRFLSFGLQFCHYIILFAFAVTRKGDTERMRYLRNTTALFSAIAILFGLLQMLYPDGPFYSLGFMVEAVVMYAYIINAQREKFIAGYFAAEEQRKSREQIEAALEKAEEASRAKTVFLSNMSHDIRTPINGIMGMVTLARKEEMSPAAQGCLDKIDGASRHLLSLVNDVLDMSRIESGKTQISEEPFDLRRLVNNCESIILGQLEGRELHFLCKTDAIKHPFVRGDELHLRQILINILGNAVKFTPDGGTVNFDVEELSADDNTVEVSFRVKDTGIGMRPEFLEHIFEAFSQEDAGSRSNYVGTGLGMSITKQLVDLMGGKITVQSKQYEGSCFTVVISFVRNEEEAPIPVREEDRTIDVKGLRVMLVEDNDLNLEIAQTMLEDEGILVTPARDGEEAVKLFADNPPDTFDVILMDIMMPGINGYEATRRIRKMKREDGQTIPIFAMTANAFDEDRRMALEAGMNAHIVKPVNFPVLMMELGRVMNKE